MARPELWMPKEPDTRLSGEIIAYGPYQGSMSGQTERLCVIKRQDGGKSTVFLTHTVLKNKFNELDPQIGDHIEIIFHGDRISQTTGRAYKDYTVQILRKTEM